MIAIFDDVKIDLNIKEEVTNIAWVNSEEINLWQKQMMEFAFRAMGNFKYMGLESWSHYQTKPEWHYDKDEDLYNQTGILAFPICSIVYYPKIDLVSGGEFITEDVTIKPKNNRLIVFSSGVYHSVNDFKGERFSVIINPWENKPKQYDI